MGHETFSETVHYIHLLPENLVKSAGIDWKSFEGLDSKILAAFLDALEENGCGISTRNHRLNCIRSFFAYAAGMNSTAVVHRAEILKVPKKKTDKPDFVDHMSEAAVRALLAQPDILTKKGLRDRFLMLLMYDTAARIQEILYVSVNLQKVEKNVIL